MKNPSFRLFGRSLLVSVRSLGAIIITLTFGGSGEAGAQIQKEDNTEALNLPASWVLGTVPDGTQIAQWDSQLTFSNNSILGANQSWQGIRILNPAGAVTITGPNPDTLVTDILTLGASGIDMSTATQSLTLTTPLVLGSSQTWSLAFGRTLNISSAGVGAVSGTGPIAIHGPGAVRLNGLGATYTSSGGISVSVGNGASNVAATPGGAALISAANLIFDLAANVPSVVGSSGPSTFSTPALTVGGVTVHSIGGARASGSGTPAWVQSSALVVAAGSSNFTQSRGSSARMINQFSSLSRTVGGTVNFRDVINSDGSNNANTGGYRTPNSATVMINGIIPYITFTKSTASSSSATVGTSFFASAGTGNNGTNYASYTASTVDSLGTATQNSTVSTDVLLSAAPAVVNSVRFNDPASRTVTIDAGNSLTIGAGAILVTNNGTSNHTITGGTLMGGNPGSGSGYDLIVHQHNNASTFTIDSVIADNTVTVVVPELPNEIVVTQTALTKSGAGKLAIGGVNTYTGTTFANSGTLLVNGALNGSISTLVSRSATLGGTGSIVNPVAIAGTLAPGVNIGTLTVGSVTFSADSTLFAQIDTSNSTADKLVVNGAISTGGTRVNLVLSDLGFELPLANGTKFTLVDYTSPWSGTDLLTYAGNTVADNSTITFGPNKFLVNYSDVAVDGTALTLTVVDAVAQTPFQTWINSYAAQIPLAVNRLPAADPDADGRDNLLEYALNGNPASGANNGKLVVSTEDSGDDLTDRDLSITMAVLNGAVLGSGPNGSMTLTVDGVVYTIEGSDSLQLWDKAVNEVIPASTLTPAPEAGWTARTFQVTDSNGLPDKRFIRVGVAEPVIEIMAN